MADGDALPNGTVLIDSEGSWMPVFKQGGEWFVVDPHTPAKGRLRTATRSGHHNRRIGWLPTGYLLNA